MPPMEKALPAPPPASPPEAGMPPATDAGMGAPAMPGMLAAPLESGQFKEQDLMQAITSDMSTVDHKNKKLDEEMKLGSQQLEDMKRKLLKEMFEAMRSVGVDPNDLNSISRFLRKLEREDPDLLTLFESAVNGLVPEEAMSSGPPLPEGGDPMEEPTEEPMEEEKELTDRFRDDRERLS